MINNRYLFYFQVSFDIISSELKYLEDWGLYISTLSIISYKEEYNIVWRYLYICCTYQLNCT